VKRGDIYWADLGPPAGRRPVLIVTRTSATEVLDRVDVVPISRTIRSIASEVPLGPDEGLPQECVAACDNVATIPKTIVVDDERIGKLGSHKIHMLDQALRFALDIRF
jgi:mRNA interferase MazF